MRLRLALAGCALAALAALGACGPGHGRRSAGREPVAPEPADRPFRETSDVERERLAALIARIPAVGADERVKIDAEIVRAGGAAVPALVDALRHPDARVRGAAAYLLGVTKDRRTIPALVDAAKDPEARVRYEAAGALLELGDERGLEPLVDGLLHADARVRSKCAAILEQATGRRFGYAADDALAERERAVRSWRAWLAMRRADRAASSADVAPATGPADGPPADAPGDGSATTR